MTLLGSCRLSGNHCLFKESAKGKISQSVCRQKNPWWIRILAGNMGTLARHLRIGCKAVWMNCLAYSGLRSTYKIWQSKIEVIDDCLMVSSIKSKQRGPSYNEPMGCHAVDTPQPPPYARIVQLCLEQGSHGVPHVPSSRS